MTKQYSSEEVKELFNKAIDLVDRDLWLTIKATETTEERMDLLAGADMMDLMAAQVLAILDHELGLVEAYNNE